MWQDGDGSKAMHDTHHIFSNAWYQAVSARTAGLNSVDLYSLTLTSNFCICVCMYISTSPTVVIMRYTNDLHTGGEVSAITSEEKASEDVEQGYKKSRRDTAKQPKQLESESFPQGLNELEQIGALRKA